MLSWFQIVRLGLVQLSIGAIVVLTTSTLNRLMVVELAVPAALPGVLVAWHYVVQMNRPSWGFRSDTKGRRTRFILGGMATLALGAFLAALGLVVMDGQFLAGLALSILAYTMIGGGAGAAGTSLLALLAAGTAPARRPAAAMTTWLLMILGIAATAGIVGALIDPYTPLRLLQIVAAVTGIAMAVTLLAVWGVERRLGVLPPPEARPEPFLSALREVWSDSRARGFTIFVFLSMVAYFLQELILEPYAGLVFGFTPGQSTGLSGAQHGGVFAGMLTVGIVASFLKIGALRTWVVAGCLGSSAALVAVAGLGQLGADLVPAVVAMGYFNGMFSVAAIASMMQLAGEGRSGREGTRMGLWGAAQAIAAGFGGLLGAAAVDLFRLVLPAPQAFGLVFLAEAGLFLIAAALAAQIIVGGARTVLPAAVPGE